MPQNVANLREVSNRDGLFFFERSDCDLPFYRGVPIFLGTGRWLIVLASVALAFTALIQAQQMFNTGVATFIPSLLFVLIPLVTLGLVGGWQAPSALFRPLRRRDFLLIIGFLVLNWIVTIIVGLLIVGMFQGLANPAVERVAGASGADRAIYFGATAIQLLGEEILTILPFLAFLTLLNGALARKTALALAALGAAVIFALVHLPTYQWNVPQALVGLVPIRLVLLLPFIITRNIWVSTGVHILNDWAIFTMTMIGGPDAAG
ncbi:peptidase [Thioclava dalianensis]|uniref:Peptidase n=1 Tax=Thioclava dalianensis TaxID=1185766 RepID=A0A074TFC9_9RHOB|nr:CPBP family glutamic-type intramembrane protease [Thioclava dalianensis]KEP68850.1 peptidase [Thioclava dalianensis]SFN22621.1 hypothetical protein SAMN05216224_10339 [Thioclava dalianensis]